MRSAALNAGLAIHGQKQPASSRQTEWLKTEQLMEIRKWGSAQSDHMEPVKKEPELSPHVFSWTSKWGDSDVAEENTQFLPIHF